MSDYAREGRVMNCARCDKLLLGRKDRVNIAAKVFEVEGSVTIGKNDCIYHLCKSCYRDLKKWVKDKPSALVWKRGNDGSK